MAKQARLRSEKRSSTLSEWPSAFRAVNARGLVVVTEVSQNAENQRNNRQHTGVRRGKIAPPLDAEFLLYLLLDRQNCDSLVGDLRQSHKLIHKRFGKRRATIWYWTQVVRLLGPIVWVWTKRAVFRFIAAVVAAKGLTGHAYWLAALVDLYRKIRS